MSRQTIGQVIERIEEAFPGWDWLVRSDGEQGAFANIMPPDFQSNFDHDNPATHGFHSYAPIPAEALELALCKALRSLLNPNGETK